MKKQFKKIILPFLAMLCMVLFSATSVGAETQRTLVGREITLSFNSTSKKDVTWSVQDKNVLQLKSTGTSSMSVGGYSKYVYSATFIGLSVGQTSVSAYDEFGSLIATAEVSVENSKYDFKLNYDCLFLSYGESFQLNPINVPDGASLTWETSEPYSSVNQLGIVSSVFPGKVSEVICRTSDGLYSAKCTIIGGSPEYYPNVYLMVGQSSKLGFSINIIDNVPEIKCKYSSTNQSVAVVDENGIVYAKAPGIANIIAEIGNKKLVYIVNVSPIPTATPVPTATPLPTPTPTATPVPTASPSPTNTPTPVPTDAPKPTYTPTPSPTPAHRHKLSITKTKATLTENGSVVTKCRTCGKVVSKKTIYRPKTISLSTTSYVYDGSTKKPKVTVRDVNGKGISSSNYTVTYPSGCKNSGTYKVKIDFVGDYSGSLTKTFSIKKSNQVIAASNQVKSLSAKNFSLNAKLTKGNGKLTYKSSNAKVATISSSGKVTIKGVGKTTITITASATTNYNKASKTVTVTVNPNGTSVISVKNSSPKSLTVQWKRNSSVTGYQIRYSTSSTFKGKKTITVKKNSTLKTTISKLTKGKTYYIQIRTYKTVSGKNYYSGWSAAKKIKITR